MSDSVIGHDDHPHVVYPTGRRDCLEHVQREAVEPYIEAIQFTAIPTIAIFAEQNAGARNALDKLRALLEGKTDE